MTSASRRRSAWTAGVVVVAAAAVLGAFALFGGSPVSGGRDVSTTPGVTSAPDLAPVAGGYALDRADPAVGGPDVIVEFDTDVGVTGAAYSAPRIVDFVLADDTLVVVTDDSGVHSVTVVDPGTSAASTVALPAPGTVDLVSAQGSRVAFVFTSAGDPDAREFASVLAWFTLGDAAATVVMHEDSALTAVAWSWVAGGETLLAIGADEELVRLDPARPDTAESLGEWEGIEGVSSDGALVIVRDHHDTVVLSLLDGEATPFGPTPIDGEPLFGGDVRFLPGSAERVQKVAVTDGATGRLDSVVIRDNGEVSTALYRASAPEGIDAFEVSPDARLVAIEVVPDVAAMVSDAYYPHARAVSVVTRVVSVDDGRVVAEIPAFGVQWWQSAA